MNPHLLNSKLKSWSPRHVVANVLDSKIVVSEFKLESCYSIHFVISTLRKDVNLRLSPTVC